MRIKSRNATQTKKIAAKLARRLFNVKSDKRHVGRSAGHATVVALTGDLGSGKTTFVQGFVKALGIKHRMVSPTFLIFRKYSLPSSLRSASRRRSNLKNFYHVDLYRIHDIKELDFLNFKSILHVASNILLIEWAEKIKKLLPKDTIWVRFEHGEKANERSINLSSL